MSFYYQYQLSGTVILQQPVFFNREKVTEEGKENGGEREGGKIALIFWYN